MFKKEIDPDEQLDTAVSALQVAIESVKQSRSQDAKVWRKKTADLQNQVQTLQTQLTESVNLNARLQNELQSVSTECERLRSVNQSLVKTLQEKEIDISRFNALNESLRSLLDGTNPVPKPTYASPVGGMSGIGQMPYQNASYDDHISRHVYEPTHDFQYKNQQYQQPQYQGYAYSPPQMPSPTPKKYQSAQEQPQKETKKSSKGKSSLFLQLAKEELTYSAFNNLINEINKYNKQKQNKQTTINNVQAILCPNHKALFDQFLPMISGI